MINPTIKYAWSERPVGLVVYIKETIGYNNLSILTPVCTSLSTLEWSGVKG